MTVQNSRTMHRTLDCCGSSKHWKNFPLLRTVVIIAWLPQCDAIKLTSRIVDAQSNIKLCVWRQLPRQRILVNAINLSVFFCAGLCQLYQS